jgi:uncharacterized protein (DUF1330 family)
LLGGGNSLELHVDRCCYDYDGNERNTQMQVKPGDEEGKRMPVYVIADVKVNDDSWIPEYAQKVHHLVHKHGGKYLSRSGNIKTLEGEPLDTTLIALLEFPSEKAAMGFVNDPDYAPFAKARQDGTDSRFQLIDDTDIAGTIDYLKPGEA